MSRLLGVFFLLLRPLLGMDEETEAQRIRQNVGFACDLAQESLGKDIVSLRPLDKATVENNWSLSCVQEPACIISPVQAEHVSQAVRIISAHRVKFATRSGGHSPNPGWSSIDGTGILIDLSGLNNVTLSGDKDVVSVGTGQRWGNVTAQLVPHGVTVVGGRVPDVGVGGLILGGGYTFLSSKHGLAADNVINFEIVTADGHINRANRKENPDLFWALKGGGSNFGIVIRYDLRVIPLPRIWVSAYAFALSQAPAVIDAFVEWQGTAASDPLSTVIFRADMDAITIGLIYLEPAFQPEIFQPFYRLKPLRILGPSANFSYTYLLDVASSETSQKRARHDIRGISSRIDADAIKQVFRFWLSRAQAVHAKTGANQTFDLQPVTRNLVRQGAANGGNPLGIAPVDQIWWTTVVDWESAAHDAMVRSVSIETTEFWAQLGRERHSDLPFIFMNDASRDQDPISTYGPASVDKLRQVANRYDPRGFLQQQQNHGFKLHKVWRP